MDIPESRSLVKLAESFDLHALERQRSPAIGSLKTIYLFDIITHHIHSEHSALPTHERGERAPNRMVLDWTDNNIFLNISVFCCYYSLTFFCLPTIIPHFNKAQPP